MAAAASRSRILVIGGTGYIGKFIVDAAAGFGHPTSILVRDAAPTEPGKAALLRRFKESGIVLVQGDIFDHESLVRAVRSADVVISAVGYALLDEQIRIIAAIKDSGNVKRFLPSEFGNDVDRAHAVDPAKAMFAKKARIRRAIEEAGIPYTYVSSNFFLARFVPSLLTAEATCPLAGKVLIVGDGNTKAIFVREEDVGAYTVRAVDDPRTLNKILYIRPPLNSITQNELVTLWEGKVGRTFDKAHLSAEELLKKIQELPAPLNLVVSLRHSALINGDHVNFEIDPSFGVEATHLYPEIRYTTVEEHLDTLL